MEEVELSTLGSVIKTAYEGQSNTNAFTDSEKTKLANLSDVASSGSYSDLIDSPDVILRSERGQSNGVAPLDSAGLVPLIHLNVSGLSFKGAWNPNTNTPSLVNGTGSVGDFYKAGNSGSFNFGNGSYTFNEGDWVIFAAGVWQRIGSSEIVTSVNGKIGMVQLDAEDVNALPDTYRPDWDSLVNKPNILPQRGMMGPPIAAALLRRSTTVNYNSGSQQNLVWNNVVYDNFNGVSGNTYVVPEWAGFARVTIFIRLSVASASGYLYVYVLRNGNEIALSGHPVQSSTNQNETVVSPIVPVSPGDILSGAIWHNHGSARTALAGETGVYMQIELFERIS